MLALDAGKGCLAGCGFGVLLRINFGSRLFESLEDRLRCLKVAFQPLLREGGVGCYLQQFFIDTLSQFLLIGIVAMMETKIRTSSSGNCWTSVRTNCRTLY